MNSLKNYITKSIVLKSVGSEQKAIDTGSSMDRKRWPMSLEVITKIVNGKTVYSCSSESKNTMLVLSQNVRKFKDLREIETEFVDVMNQIWEELLHGKN